MSSSGSGGSEESSGQGVSEEVHPPAGVQRWLKVMAGQTWPEGSESGLRAIAQACRDFEKVLRSVQEELPAGVAGVRAGLVGQAADAFGQSASGVVAELGQVCQQLGQMADAAENAAADIQKAKIMIVAMMVMMLVAIAELLATIFGALAIPGEVATTRALIQGIMAALRAAMSKAASMAAVRSLVTSAVKYAALGAGFMGGMDLGIQVFQEGVLHDRTAIDWSSVGHSLESGAIGGAGFGAGHAIAEGARSAIDTAADAAADAARAAAADVTRGGATTEAGTGAEAGAGVDGDVPRGVDGESATGADAGAETGQNIPQQGQGGRGGEESTVGEAGEDRQDISGRGGGVGSSSGDTVGEAAGEGGGVGSVVGGGESPVLPRWMRALGELGYPALQMGIGAGVSIPLTNLANGMPAWSSGAAGLLGMFARFERGQGSALLNHAGKPGQAINTTLTNWLSPTHNGGSGTIGSPRVARMVSAPSVDGAGGVGTAWAQHNASAEQVDGPGNSRIGTATTGTDGRPITESRGPGDADALSRQTAVTTAEAQQVHFGYSTENRDSFGGSGTAESATVRDSRGVSGGDGHPAPIDDASGNSAAFAQVVRSSESVATGSDLTVPRPGSVEGRGAERTAPGPVPAMEAFLNGGGHAVVSGDPGEVAESHRGALSEHGWPASGQGQVFEPSDSGAGDQGRLESPGAGGEPDNVSRPNETFVDDLGTRQASGHRGEPVEEPSGTRQEANVPSQRQETLAQPSRTSESYRNTDPFPADNSADPRLIADGTARVDGSVAQSRTATNAGEATPMPAVPASSPGDSRVWASSGTPEVPVLSTVPPSPEPATRASGGDTETPGSSPRDSLLNNVNSAQARVTPMASGPRPAAYLESSPVPSTRTRGPVPNSTTGSWGGNRSPIPSGDVGTSPDQRPSDDLPLGDPPAENGSAEDNVVSETASVGPRATSPRATSSRATGSRASSPLFPGHDHAGPGTVGLPRQRGTEGAGPGGLRRFFTERLGSRVARQAPKWALPTREGPRGPVRNRPRSDPTTVGPSADAGRGSRPSPSPETAPHDAAKTPRHNDVATRRVRFADRMPTRQTLSGGAANDDAAASSRPEARQRTGSDRPFTGIPSANSLREGVPFVSDGSDAASSGERFAGPTGNSSAARPKRARFDEHNVEALAMERALGDGARRASTGMAGVAADSGRDSGVAPEPGPAGDREPGSPRQDQRELLNRAQLTRPKVVGKIDAALLRARILDLVGRSDDYPTLRRLVQLEFSDDKQTENWLHHRKGFGARANAGGPEITVRAVGLGPPRDQRRGITDFEHEHSRLPVDHSSSSERATTGSGSMFGRIWALYVMVQAQLDGMVNPRGAGLSTATRHESGTKVAESNVPSVTSRHNVGYEVTVDGNGRWPWSKPRSRTDHVAVGVELAWPDRPPANPAHDHGSALTRHELDAIEHIEFSAIDDIHDQVEQEIGGFRPNDPESVRFHTWLSSLDKSVLAEPVRNSFTFAGHGPTELMVAVGQPVEGGSPRPVTVRELPDENGTITNSEVTSAENTSVQWVDHQHGIGVRVAAGDASSPVTGWAIGPIDTERFSTKNDGAITERHQRESTETYTGGLAKRQADLTFVVMVRSSGKGPVIRFDEQKRLPVLAKPHHVVKVPNTATWWSRRTAQPRPSEAAGPTQRGEFQESSTVAGHRQVAEPAESGAVEVPSRPDRYRVTDRIDARYWLSREAAQAVVGRIMPELATPDLLPVRGARAQFVPFADRALHALAPKNPAGSVATAWVRFLGSASQALHRLASHPIRPDKLPWIRTRLLSFLTDNAREAATGEVRFPLGALLHDDKVPDIFIGVPAPPVAAEYLGVRTGEKLGGKIGASHEHRVVVTRRRDTVRGIAGIGYYEENNYPTYQAVYGTSTAHPRHVAREVGYERSFDSTEPVHRYRYQTPFRVSFGRSWSHRSGKTLEIDPLRWAPTVEVSAPGDPWPELPAAGVAVPHQPVTEHAADAPTDGTWHDGDPSDEPGIPVPAGVVPVSLNRVPGAVRTMSEMLSERRPGAWRPWSNVSRPFVGGNPPEFDEHTGGGHRSADPANLDEQNPALDWLEAFGSRQGRETGFDRAVLREDTTPPLKSHNFGGPLGSRDGFARVAYSIRLYRPRVLSGLVKRPVNQSIYTKTTLGGGVQETRRGSLAGDSLVVEPIVKTFATGVDAIVGLEYERNRSSDTERSVKITVSSEHGEYGYLLGVDATHVVRTSARRQWQDLFGFRHPTSAAARTRWRRVPDNEVWVPASEIHRIPGLSEGDIAKLAPDDQARYRQEQPVSEPQEGTHSAPQHLTGSAPSRLARSGSEVRPKPEAGAYPAPRDSMLRPPENAGRGRGTMEWYDQKAPIALIQQMDETLAEWSRQTGQADPAWSPGDLVNRVFGKPPAERDPTMPKFDELHEQLVSDELGPIMVGHRGNATLREMLNGGRAVLLQGDNVQQLVVLRARPGKGEYQRTIPNQTTRISHETVNRDGSSYRHGWLGQLGFGVLHMVGRSGEPAMLSITGALFTHSRMKGLERSQENRETLKAESSGDRLQFTHALTVDLDVYPYQGPGVYTRLLSKLLPGRLAELAPRVIGEPWRHEFTFRPGTVRSTVPREECVPVEPIESVTGSLREWQRDQQRSLGLSDDATLYVDQFPAPGLHTRLHEIIRGESEADRPRLPMRPGAANQLFADASRRADLLRDAMTEAGHVVDLIDGPVRRVKITVDLEQRELLGVVENGSRTRDVSQSENLKLTSDHKTEFGMTHTTQLRAPAVAGEGNRPVLGALSLGHPLAQRTREHQNEVSTETKSAEDNGEQTWYRVRVTPRWHVLGSGRREKLPAPARKVLRTGQWLASAGRRFPAFWRKVVRADQWLMLASADRQREFPDFLRKVLNTGRDGRSDEPIELVVNQRGLEDLGLHVPRVDDPLRDWLIYDRWLNPGQEGAPDGAGQDRAPADTAGPDRAEVTVDEIGGPFMSGALPPVERDHEVEATLAADEADPMSGRVVSAPESTEGTAGAESVDALVLPPVWEYHRSVPAVAGEVVKTETGVDSPVDRRDVSDVVEAHRNRLEEKLAAILPPYDGTAADCVVRLDAVRRGLFGGSVVARDDFAVGSRRPEDELTAAVGGDWRPVDGSLADVVRQVEELGHGAMAFVLTRPPGRTGHGFAVRNEGGIPLWLETQARPGSRVREVGQDLPVDARVIVVDATGRAVPLAAGSRAANTTDALLPPSAQRRYGARGAERTHDDVSGRGRTGDPEPADPSRASGGFQTRRVSSRRTGGRKPSGEPSRPGDGGLTFFPALPDSSGPRTTGHPGRDDLERGQASSPHPLPIREKHSGRDALTRPVSRGSGQNAGSGFSRDDLGRGQRSAAASHQPEPNPSRSSSGYGSAEELRADLEREIKRAHPSGAVPDGGALGPDYFGLRDLPAPPDFVRGHNHRDLASWQVVELFERLDLTRAGAPSWDEMDPKKWPYRPERELRPGKKWSERYWANKLPPITTPLTLPRAMSSIWTGGPHVDDGFMTNLEKRAEVAHREGWSVVLLTDVPRIEFEAATLRNRPAGVSQGHFQEVARVRSRLREDHLRAVRRLWKRARDNGIWLVNIWEVRHRENPMRLHDAFVTELNKQIRPGYASTSDILRWENAVAFGLPYADPDDIVHTFKYLQDVLDSEDGYAIQKTNRGIANSVIVVPKGHPIAPVALEVINGNYRLRQKELAPHMSEEMEDLWKIFELDTDPSRIVRRYSTTMRSGPELLDKVAMAVGYDYLSDFPGAKGIEMGGAASWLRKPPTGTGRISSSDWRGTLEFAKRFFATMVRGRHNVRGDLNLVELSKALEKHDDPDLIWNATLSVFASRPELGGRIRSATTSRFENGGWHDVELPAEATRLLRYTGESIITENGDERQAVTMLSPAEVSRALIAEQASRRRDRDA